MRKVKGKFKAGRQLLMNNCDVCGDVYETTRRDSKTCGPRCRQIASREARKRLGFDALAEVECRYCGIVGKLVHGRCVTCGSYADGTTCLPPQEGRARCEKCGEVYVAKKLGQKLCNPRCKGRKEGKPAEASSKAFEAWEALREEMATRFVIGP